MANIIKWARDRAQQVADTASRVYDQVNVLDNGRTFNQRTPTNQQSVIQQAAQAAGNTPIARAAAPVGRVLQQAPQAYQAVKNIPAIRSLSNPVTRFVDNNFLEPALKAEGNAGKLLQQRNPYSGSGQQQAGQALQDVISIAGVAPIGGGARLAAQGAKAAIRPIIKQGAIAGAKVGAGFGAAQGVATSLKEEQNLPQSIRAVATNTALGGGLGAGAGVAAPFVGAGVRKTVQTAKKVNTDLGEGGFAKIPSSKPEPTAADIVNSGNTRPQAELQRAYEAAHNSGNVQEAERIAKALDDPALSGTGSAPGAVEAAKARMQAAMNPEQPLPIRNTKREGNISKALRSTRSVIERQGESGKVLGSMLQQGRDTQELLLAGVQKQIPTLRKLKGKAFENFVDATQGLAKPLNPRIAQAVQEWKALHPAIRQRAVDAGLDVGDLGENYYPHFIDYDRVFKDTNTFNKAINHLVETGQAPNQDEAIKLLGFARDTSRNRQFGNLEASRLVDLPFYDKTPNSLISYLSGSGKRIAQTETFGAKDEKALKLISQIGQEGGDTEAAKNAYDVAVGAKQYNPTTTNVSQNIRRYITTTRLGLGALTNVSQNVNTGIVTGHMRTLAAAAKQLDPKTRAFVGDTGVIADAVLNDMRTQRGDTFGARAAGRTIKAITAPLFGTVEKINRSISATAGRDYGLRLAQKGDERTLRRLGVTGEIRNKTLTPEQQIQVARKVVEKTQFKVDPQDLPGWVDTPGGKLVAQFRTFSYSQGKFVSNEILKPIARGNLLPLARLLAALPLGYALYETKRVIAGRPEEEDKKKVGLSAFQNVGGAGLAFDLYQTLNPVGSKYIPSDRRTTMAVGAFGGPAVGVAAQGAGAISEAIQRKNTPTDESRLEGKVVAGKTPESYTDLTPISRFGLQQVPIVGTAVKNRLLPFKKEADADVGKKETGAATTADTLKADSRQRSKDFKSSLSKDDYAISQLSKVDQEKLVSQGTITKEKLDGLRSYVKDKKKELGYSSSSTTDLRSSPEAEYKAAKEKYEQDKKDGKISGVKDVERVRALKKLEVGSTYDKDLRDLYSLSKQQIYDYVTTNPDGNKLVAQLSEYDQKLHDAGLTPSLKFKTGIAPAKKGSDGTKAKTAKAAKAASTRMAKAIQLPKVGRVRQSRFAVKGTRSPKFSVPKVRSPKITNTALNKLTGARTKIA